jgi:hypothetical protein
MSNIIPFDDNNARLPAYLKKVDVAALNADLTSHAGGGFPIISIKGKVFTEVRDGERKILMNPKDPDSVAGYIEVVLLKVNKHLSKVWYATGYVDGQEAKKPECYSPDGVAPAADSEKPQSKTCATCKFNQWGSKVTEGGKKAKACTDTVRMAIAKPDLLNDPYLLRVPPATIRVLGEYGQMLAKRGVAYNMVVTRISFDQAEATPKLQFRPTGLLDEASYTKVQEMIESDVVKNILGANVGFVDEITPNEKAAGAVPEAKAEPARQAAKVAEVVISKAKNVSTEEVVGTINKATQGSANVSSGDLGELDLGNLNFDD